MIISPRIRLVCGIIAIMGLAFLQYQGLWDRCVRIPVTFNTAGIPVIEGRINEVVLPFQLDLGSKFELTLGHDLLVQIEKVPCGTECWADVSGNGYESPLYVIPRVAIGGIVLTRAIAQEEHQDLMAQASITRSGQVHRPESVGRPLLKRGNLLLNFSQSEIIVCNNLRRLKKLGLSVATWTPVSFFEKHGVMLLSISSDLGDLVFMLDTGATGSIISPAVVQGYDHQEGDYGLKTFTSSTFVMGGKDFGPQKLYLWECQGLGIDGVLGMDFFQTHLVYIDQQNHQLYIREANG